MSDPNLVNIALRVPMPEDVRARLQAAYPEANFIYCPGDVGLAEHLPQVDAIIGSLGLTADTVRKAARLKWVQVLGVGIEKFMDPCLIERKVQVANARGVNVANLAEHAIAMMLAFARGFPELMRRQADKAWLPGNGPMLPVLSELNGSRLCLIGYGEIGKQIARRAKALDMDVWAMRRTPAEGGDGIASRILPPEALHEMIAAADHLLLMVPLTPDTEGLIGAEQLALMKPSAYLYNMGRGKLVDQDALIAALNEGRIAGAGLDTTTPEPLPSDSALWTTPNVLITAHTAGNTPRFFPRIVDFLEVQLGLFREGKPLEKVVDLQSGY
jgi:phosphoglycerate dehydrogenase-like enzyme